ncbi:MAG: type 1 glutamine amidotransferase [Acidimicrobiia bacterium]
MSQSRLRIGLIFPDLLGTYGDRGNALVLLQRARWRNLDAEIVEVAASEPIPDSLDIYLLGGGEDAPQMAASAGLRGSAAAIDRARANGAVVLAICAGFQLIGTSYVDAEGTVLDGLGLIDVETRSGAPRCIGEVVVEPEASLELPMVTGFENHGGRTTLGDGVRPFGRAVVGYGNGVDGADGALGERLIATYLHGPVLPRNVALADRLLGWVLNEPLAPLDDVLEERLRAERIDDALLEGMRAWWRDRKLARG